ncbi:MAG: hypothetical protein A3K19_30800 [Lentisphaerae bacterium RIFOXYB12_FULL_65_16]|nr:MAG: hypothetical protein A3K18_04095 [Lentisphaerae bacterium RIFOXYA12_64_32]OGV88807.1 MAG: hypothetical protein A3K19_30800 [Lentisphaerae bacterium RIFOXYB12_FULL_65_16]
MRLSDIAEINPATDVSRLGPTDPVSFIPMSDVSDDGRWLGGDARPLCSVRNGYTCFAEGDVLFAKITPCMENGKGCRAAGLINGVGFGSTEFHVLRARSDADAGYLYQWTKSRELRKRAANSMVGSAGQQRVPADFLRDYPIGTHSTREQSAIARVLDCLDRAIEQTEAVVAKQERIKAGLLHDLLTRGLDADGRLRDPATHRFKPSPLGPIPEEWKVTPLEAMRREDRPFIKTGPFGTAIKQSDWVETGVPVITIGSLGPGRILRSGLQFLREEKALELASYRVEEGDILFSRVADVGRCILVSSSEAGWIMSSNLMRISLDPAKAVPSFAHLALLGERTAEQTRRSVNAGGRDVVNTAILLSLVFAWPPRGEQDRIILTCKSHDSAVWDAEAGLAKFRRLKAGLMHDLLTGRVPVAPLLEGAHRCH